MHTNSGFVLCLLSAIVVFGFQPRPSVADDPLFEGFVDPPPSARPRVWWHWMNGNVTKEGIAKDLDWMQRVGIGGLQSFDANLRTPQLVDQRLSYMTPPWREAFRFAADYSEKKGLELAIASSPGWSETGGPWVKAEDAMKKLVWSETTIEGGKRFLGNLPIPPRTTGPYKDIRLEDSPSLFREGTSIRPPEHYADVTVLAYPVAWKSGPGAIPRITAGDGQVVDAAALMDGRLSTFAAIKRGTRNAPASLLVEYDTPQTIRSLTLFMPSAVPSFGGASVMPRLEAIGSDGQWRKIADIPLTKVSTTVSFAAHVANKFRVVFAPTPPKQVSVSIVPAPGLDASALATSMPKQPQELEIADLQLSSAPAVHLFEIKAGFSVVDDYYALQEEGAPEEVGIDPGKVLNLTDRMNGEGVLDWTPPKGEWRVVRLGWSLVGKLNHPATDEATGLEVDKMDRDAVRRYLEQYIGMYKDAVGEGLLGNAGVRALLNDSTEVGAFNWTPKMIDHFKQLRGYDPTPWLLTLTGAIIGSRQQSDAFLYDFRRTIADLHATEHYGTIAEIAHAHGLKVYGEALESQRPSLGDDMKMRSFADYPMAALWTYPRGSTAPSAQLMDLKGASSAAHLYGRTIVAAESLTSVVMPWAHAPSDLRPVIDLAFASGINRPVVHTSAHQPLDDKVPGLSLSIFGQYFTRHESWAELARPWVNYMARNSYLLQQGLNVADVAYFYGEEAPLVGLYQQRTPADVPSRYAYDFVNSEALLDLLAVEHGDLVTKSGARYRALYLGGSSRFMTVPTLRRVAQLVEAGATVVGSAPRSSPSLKDDKGEFAALVGALWGPQPQRRVGKGRVISGTDIEAALASIEVPPDFTFTKAASDSEILFVHRKLPDGDIYFLTNRKNRPESIEARFRVAGKQPELWRADAGSTEAVSYRIDGQTTIVPLSLAPEESFFVVFRKPASVSSLDIPPVALKPVMQLTGAWDVSFQENRGAPASVHLEQLVSLSEHGDPGVKYFSGIATYSKEFTLPKLAKRGADLMLDLGQVGDLAEVRLNGRAVGTVWHAPYRIDISAHVRPGKNQLELRVANLWVNRLIGDAQPGVEKTTWTAIPTYTAKAPLRPSGLIGPVEILAQQ